MGHHSKKSRAAHDSTGQFSGTKKPQANDQEPPQLPGSSCCITGSKSSRAVPTGITVYSSIKDDSKLSIDDGLSTDDMSEGDISDSNKWTNIMYQLRLHPKAHSTQAQVSVIIQIAPWNCHAWFRQILKATLKGKEGMKPVGTGTVGVIQEDKLKTVGMSLQAYK
ncbi:hypothetical protein K488DRAFT_74424 [Vararia minispora EC-137]|uniref:Uncharacterized protein n=1 Tax=Vararia minispora EC-137 TaxID=1314806 RepID=A0ACB8Q709_9AGAM|nr:hypothetical protein K488DRAFT_74424 [Vararia minispora EC-137]